MNYWFFFYKSDIMLERLPDGAYTIPLSEESPIEMKAWMHALIVSPMTDVTEVKTVELDTPIIDNERYEMCGLRPSFYKLDRELYNKAGKCAELLYWDHNTKYCGVCGAPMKMHTDISKRCTACGKEVWPQLSTAIITLIHRGDEIVMVHARNFKGCFYGLVAGFVETGETLEQAVKREVMEETHLSVKNLQYFDSQPWPYPCGLMVGFIAEYDSGDIKLQNSELSSGGWYNIHKLPELPEKLSIARRMIDYWINSHSTK